MGDTDTNVTSLPKAGAAQDVGGGAVLETGTMSKREAISHSGLSGYFLGKKKFFIALFSFVFQISCLRKSLYLRRDCLKEI